MSLINYLKRNTFIKLVGKNIYAFTKKAYMIFCNKFYGINKEKITFISFGGKSYSDNPKAISEKLHELYPDFDIVWLFDKSYNKNNITPEYISFVEANSFKALKTLATSKFWVDNFNKPLFMYKGEEQVYIQTWHGDRGFKKILNDSTFIKSNNYKLFESKACDLTVAGSDYGVMQYRSGFKYTGPILKKGYPRNDVLIEDNLIRKNKIRNSLNIDNDTKILLYAPTLRRQASKHKSKQKLANLDLLEVITVLEHETNENWVCFVRSHSAVSGFDGVPDDKRFIDVSNIEDMSELLLISDILITDYSSSAGDYALLNRPIILFQNDRKDYLEKDRTFYFDIDKSPFIVAKDQNDLISFIKNLRNFDAKKNCEEILKFYGAYETGKSSEAVVKYIISNIEGEK